MLPGLSTTKTGASSAYVLLTRRASLKPSSEMPGVRGTRRCSTVSTHRDCCTTPPDLTGKGGMV